MKLKLFTVSLLFSFFLFSVQVSQAFASINWGNTTSLPLPLASHVAFIYSNKIHVLGGATGQTHPIAIHSLINPDGSLEGWVDNSINSPSLFWHSVAQKDNYVYLLGGAAYPPVISQDTVYLGKINENDDIDSWILLQPLPKKLSEGNSLVLENKLYYAGGFTEGGSINSDIYFSVIKPDGTIEEWHNAGQLPDVLSGFGFIQYGGRMYVLGGKNSTSSVDNVRSASINPDGTIGNWTELEPLPEKLNRAGVALIEDTVYVLGGDDNGTPSPRLYTTNIGNAGDISNWNLDSTLFPRQQCCSPLITDGHSIYLLGGHDGVNYFSDVYFSKLSTNIDSLNVPLLKQTSDPWQGEIYDSANIWSSVKPTIYSWGCALTSAAMIMNYYKIDYLPNGSELNPGTLNEWLKDQPDGYLSNGLINWLAISRLSKEAKLSGHNNNFSYDALEYSRITENSVAQLNIDLDNNIPGILELPGHFVVAKGRQDNTYSINDPFFNRLSLNDTYNNSFLNLGRFIPSNTDLSYIMLSFEKTLSATLINSARVNVGEEFIQQPINNPEDNKPNNDSIKMIYFSKPESDNYLLKFNSISTRQLITDVYIYTVTGDVKKMKISAFLSPNNPESFNIDFNKNNASLQAIKKQLTFKSVIQDIDEALKLRLVNKSLAFQLINILKAAEKDEQKGKSKIAKSKLEVARFLVLYTQKILIKNTASLILLEDIKLLKDTF